MHLIIPAVLNGNDKKDDVKDDVKEEEIKYQNVHARTGKGNNENRVNTNNKNGTLSPTSIPENKIDIRWEKDLKNWSIL